MTPVRGQGVCHMVYINCKFGIPTPYEPSLVRDGGVNPKLSSYDVLSHDVELQI